MDKTKKIIINILKFFKLSNKIELWVKVRHPYSDYKISNLGRVKNKKGKYLKPIKCRYGYLRIRYFVLGKRVACSLNREVMIAFYKEKDEEVNHIDRVKSNNFYGNLEYVSPKENQKHWRNIEKQKKTKGDNMLIGETFRCKDGCVYTKVNKVGTLEKLGKLPWRIRLYLEIRNGILKPLSLKELRSYREKYAKYN